MTIAREGALISYSQEDFTPGHSPFCSYQLFDPAKCPICKDWPETRKSKPASKFSVGKLDRG